MPFLVRKERLEINKIRINQNGINPQETDGGRFLWVKIPFWSAFSNPEILD